MSPDVDVNATSARESGSLVVEEVSEVTPELVEAFVRLTPQLSQSCPPPGPAELAEMLASPATTVFMARQDEGHRDDGARSYIGSLTLVLFRIPTGMRAWVEDVVVDEAARGRGVGEALMRAAIERATAAGARTIDLTSRPSREAANRLYQRLSFTMRETNVYRWSQLEA